MSVRNIAKSVSILAPGSRTAIDQPQANNEDHTAEEYEGRLLSLEALAREVLTAGRETMSAAVNVISMCAEKTRELNEAIERLKALAPAERDIMQRLDDIEQTLTMPVKPIYDKSGKIIGAKREALTK